MNEKEFYTELANTPEMPRDVFSSIQTRIRRKNRLMRSAYGLAAVLILALGVGVFLEGGMEEELRAEAQPSEQILEEIEYVDEYFAGENLEREMEAYTLVDYRFYE